MTIKNLSGRLARWSLQLQGYNFAIEHRKGSDNVVADMLSCSVEEVHMAPTDLLGFETTAFGADAYQKLVRKGELNKRCLPNLKTKDGFLFKRVAQKCLSDERWRRRGPSRKYMSIS